MKLSCLIFIRAIKNPRFTPFSCLGHACKTTKNGCCHSGSNISKQVLYPLIEINVVMATLGCESTFFSVHLMKFDEFLSILTLDIYTNIHKLTHRFIHISKTLFLDVNLAHKIQFLQDMSTSLWNI